MTMPLNGIPLTIRTVLVLKLNTLSEVLTLLKWCLKHQKIINLLELPRTIWFGVKNFPKN